VTGIGGIFFKAENPQMLYEWYERHLGIRQDVPGQGVSFRGKEDGAPDGFTVWSIFRADTKYFQPSTPPFMLNFRVQNLDELVEALRAEAVWIDPKREDYDYGRFAWIMDPEGNRIELWEPPRHS
jgi:predicted enzyme related to lactoylglutathione lyase